MQSKDIPDRPILEFLARPEIVDSIGANWIDLDGDCDREIRRRSVRQVMPHNVPDKLVLGKMRQLIHRGVVDGCGCGCRGDFTITSKGLAELE